MHYMHMVRIHCIVHSLTLSYQLFLIHYLFFIFYYSLIFYSWRTYCSKHAIWPENEGFTKTLAENIFIKPFKEAAAKSSVEIHAKRSFNKTLQQNPSTKPFKRPRLRPLLVSRYPTHFPICHSFPDNYIFTQKDLKTPRRQHLGWEPLNT